MRSFVILVAALGATISFGPAALAVPAAVPYVGWVTQGDAPATGTFDVGVALYPAASGAQPLWGPFVLGDVAVDKGLLSIVLGGADTAPIDTALIASDQLWLELSLDGAPLAPRQHVLSVPYARLAHEAETLSGMEAGDLLTTLDDQRLTLDALQIAGDLLEGLLRPARRYHSLFVDAFADGSGISTAGVGTTSTGVVLVQSDLVASWPSSKANAFAPLKCNENLLAGNERLAQRFQSSWPATVAQVKLHMHWNDGGQTGEYPLRAGEVSVRVYTNASGVPGVPVAGSASLPVSTSSISQKNKTGLQPVTFSFPAPRPVLQPGVPYHLVAETTAVYGDNHGVTQWGLDTGGATTYGLGPASWQSFASKGWANQAGYTFIFELLAEKTTRACATSGPGTLVSPAIVLTQLPLALTLMTVEATGAGTISYSVSRNGGAAWLPILPEVATDLAPLAPGLALHYRAQLPAGACLDTIGVGWR